VLAGCKKSLEQLSPGEIFPGYIENAFQVSSPYWTRASMKKIKQDIPAEYKSDLAVLGSRMREYNEIGQLGYRMLNVMLGESRPPSLYQIMRLRFSNFDPSGQHIVDIEVAFTLKLRDAPAGIKDFNNEFASGIAWEWSDDPASTFTLASMEPVFTSEEDHGGVPFQDRSRQLNEMGTIKLFFNKYFSQVNDFAIIALKVIFFRTTNRSQNDVEEPSTQFIYYASSST
jgi:hypothetical protein